MTNKINHVYEVHTDCELNPCPICDGGLAWCIVCKRGECDLDKYCPGPKEDDVTGVSEAIISRIERIVKDGLPKARREKLVSRLKEVFPELTSDAPSSIESLCEPPPDGQVCSEAVEGMRAMWTYLKRSKVKYKDGHKVYGLDGIPHKDSVIALMKWVGSSLVPERDR